MARDVGDDNLSPVQAMIAGAVMVAVGVLFWLVASAALPGSVSVGGRIPGFFIIVPVAGLVLFGIGVVGAIRSSRRR